MNNKKVQKYTILFIFLSYYLATSIKSTNFAPSKLFDISNPIIINPFNFFVS